MNCKTLAVCTLLLGCADLDPSLLPSDRESLAATAAAQSSLGCPKPCVLSPTSPGFDEIHAKRNALDRALRDSNFARQTTSVHETAGRDGYFQFFEGTHGRGAIYYKRLGAEPSSVHTVYGAILDEWERLGFEEGELGYPTSDEYDDESGRRQRFTSRKLPRPEPNNGCLIETERYLVWQSGFDRAHVVEEDLYRVDNHPHQPSREPQQVTDTWVSPIWGPEGYAIWEHFWCGPPSPGGPMNELPGSVRRGL